MTSEIAPGKSRRDFRFASRFSVCLFATLASRTHLRNGAVMGAKRNIAVYFAGGSFQI
jgi:hypothetical protein